MGIMNEQSASLSRRSFLGFAAVGAAAAGMTLQGCSPDRKSRDAAQEIDSPRVPSNVTETIDADVVVIGMGMSGLAAVVQAALNGDKVVGVEATSVTGGNGIGVEGIFAVGTDMQKAAGIEVTPVEIIQTELSSSQMLSDGTLWKNLISASADNVSWLIEQGVEFSGTVDNYLGSGIVSCFHWFKGNVASAGYIPQMTARAQQLGVDMRMSTRAHSLIVEEGRIAGVYVQDESDKDIQINAKAVILATGGYAQNQQYMEERGWNWDNIVYGGTPNHNGEGLKMAFEAGARSFIRNSTFNCTNICGTGSTFAWKADNFTSLFCGAGMFGMGGNQMWVNQDAERFVPENFAATNFEMQSVPAMTQRAMYSVFDRSILEATLAAASDTETLSKVDAATEVDLAVADTLADAAEKIGLNVDVLTQSVKRYNDLCAGGRDEDFGKPAELMVPIEQGPFYIAKLNQYFLMSVGGIECTLNAQAVDATKNPIEGLYAVGTDGCMLYRNIYTIDVGGTCNANNVNSGRTAANHAHAAVTG